MYIETWRWRLAILLLAAVVIVSGGYGLLHPATMELNICCSLTSPFLQRLNPWLSSGAYLLVMAGGGTLVWYVIYSIQRGMAIREERPPIDYRDLTWTVIAYVLLIAALALAIVYVPRFLRSLRPEPYAPHPATQSE